jgi:hypothetical protein
MQRDIPFSGHGQAYLAGKEAVALSSFREKKKISIAAMHEIARSRQYSR